MRVQMIGPRVGLHNDAAPSRREVVRRLIAACLVDPEMSRLLDRHRDGLVQRVPPLRELQALRRSA